MKHYIGIDNSKLTHSVFIIDENGNLMKELDIENNYSGFEKLRILLTDYENPVIAFELPHGPLIDYLRKLPYKLYSLNPLKVKRFKEIYSVSGDKTDKVDSNAIAQYIRINEKQSRELIFNSPEIETLKILGISHERFTKEHTRYSLRLMFILRQYLPLYDDLFSTSAPQILLKLVQKYPKWSDLASESKENLIHFFVANRYRKIKCMKKILQKIRDYEHCIMPEVEIALSIEAIAIANILLSLKTQLSLIEKKMADITQAHRMGEIFYSLPGAGKILATKLLGLLGDNKNRFSKANQAQSLFGTAPINYQSGGYHKVMMRRACNKRGKSILYTFAFSSLRYSKWAREYYDKQRKLGKNHSVVVRALSNKWLKIIFSMWKNNCTYNQDQQLLAVA